MVGTGKAKAPVVLGKKEEDILKAVRFYRYMTALDVCYLLYKPSILTTVRRVLSELSGGGDFVTNQYLYRFRMPDTGRGTPERIYTLGSRGRDLLVSEFGLTVNWYFRPGKAKQINYSQLMHNLVLTRFLVAADWWVRQLNHPGRKSGGRRQAAESLATKRPQTQQFTIA